MSYIATQVQSILEELFPAKPFPRVFAEHYVNFKGTRLFFDFYVKGYNLFVEVQGQQHTRFVKHFHGDKKNYQKQRDRDNLKIIWTEQEGLHLVRINYDEKITKTVILKKIKKAMEGNFYE